MINERNGAERGYYCKTYYQEILKKNEDFYFDLDESDEDIAKINNNLVNIELYPLRSKDKNGAEYKINKFSLFGAYIILYRIGRYLNEVEKNPNIQKPRFIFRSFKKWKECITAAIKSYLKLDDDLTNKVFECLYDDFFFEFSSPAYGYVSSNNLIKQIKIENDSFNKEKIGVERFDKVIASLSKPNKWK